MEPWSPEILKGHKLGEGPDLKGGTSDPSSYHNNSGNYIHLTQ